MRIVLSSINPFTISLAAMTAVSEALHHHTTRAAAQHPSIPPTPSPAKTEFPPLHGSPFHLPGTFSGTQMLRRSVRLFRGARAILAPANREALHDILTAKRIGRITPTVLERLGAIKLFLKSAGKETGVYQKTSRPLSLRPR